MRKIVIKTPIWKDRSVGIADYLINEDLEVEITYKKSDRTRLYPDPFYITMERAKTFPTLNIRGTILRIIPICEMENRSIKKIELVELPKVRQERLV